MKGVAKGLLVEGLSLGRRVGPEGQWQWMGAYTARYIGRVRRLCKSLAAAEGEAVHGEATALCARGFGHVRLAGLFHILSQEAILDARLDYSYVV